MSLDANCEYSVLPEPSDEQKEEVREELAALDDGRRKACLGVLAKLAERLPGTRKFIVQIEPMRHGSLVRTVGGCSALQIASAMRWLVRNEYAKGNGRRVNALTVFWAGLIIDSKGVEALDQQRLSALVPKAHLTEPRPFRVGHKRTRSV